MGNRDIDGLFFSTNLDGKGNRFNHSFYGDTRICIDAKVLLKNTDLYFADFYCINEAHYVTIIACNERSSEPALSESTFG
uniref:Phytanoyl-CoA hydroxylase-interacting protein-like C-terminal domain-containing protein n=1 Tax=Acrobeloides nanus TaxID=290746 RepID=A0A914EEE7_9BILA